MASKSAKTNNKVPLAELLGVIADELIQAKQNAIQRGQPVMIFQECELEFSVETEKSTEGEIKIWVVNLGGNLQKTNTNTIRLKFNKFDDSFIGNIGGVIGPDLKRQPQSNIKTKK
jgi:hypothetical protein